MKKFKKGMQTITELNPQLYNVWIRMGYKELVPAKKTKK